MNWHYVFDEERAKRHDPPYLIFRPEGGDCFAACWTEEAARELIEAMRGVVIA